MAKDLAIVLNDGTLNASVATALAAQKYRPVLLYVTTPAEEQGNKRRGAYDAQVGHFKPYREHSIVLPGMPSAPNSGPSDGDAAESIDSRQLPPLTPQLRKNVPWLGLAVSYALHYEAAAIYLPIRIGGHGDDLARGTEFLQVWNELVQLTLEVADLTVLAPLLELDAWQVVDLGFQVGAPLDRTWNCRNEAGEPCGTCRGCRERDAAFMRSAKPDPARAIRKT